MAIPDRARDHIDAVPAAPARLRAVPPEPERRRVLELLARAAFDPDGTPPVAGVTLTDVAHPSLHGADLDTALEELSEALYLRHRFERGECDWRDVNPDLTCLDRDTAAADDCRRFVADAFDTLLNGR